MRWLIFAWLVAASTGFHVVAAESLQLRPWTNYQTIMWVSDSAYRRPEKVPLFFQRLREMGINTAMVHGDGNLRPLLENKFPYYVENMVTRGLCLKFQSKVTDWDKFVTEWNKTGRGDAAFVRDYSLDDPEWQKRSRRQMQDLVRKNMTNAPLAYDIRDELSITHSANPFDYDFSSTALDGFRAWLKTQYTNLTALNAQWDTSFASWEAVRPFTTDQIKNRMASGDAMPRGKLDSATLQQLRFSYEKARTQPVRWNLSPWCDFRTYMDLSLARTLGVLRDAARELDPHTPVGIEGTQMPSAWGGYDLWRLSQALDWVEPYDIGNSREIFGSFMPGKAFMTTVFEKDTEHARRRLWHLLLEGDRGCIVWWSEDCIDWKSDDYALTPKGKALAPVLKEMSTPLARIFQRARRQHDPIFLAYSHPSVQVDWLIESTRDGLSWHRRFSSFEAQHNEMAKKRNGWVKLFQDLGYSPQFLAADQMDNKFQPSGRASVLVLSDARALSLSQAQAAAMILDCPPEASSNTLFCDSPVAAFDEHGKLRTNDTILSRFTSNAGTTVGRRIQKPGAPPSISVTPDARKIIEFNRERLRGKATDWYDWAERQIAVPREVTVAADTHTRVHRYTLGDARLFAFERNIDYHMSEELKQAGGNELLEKAADIKATLARGGHVYDLRTGKYLGNTSTIAFKLDPWQPSLFAVLPAKLTDGDLVTHLLNAK